MEGFSVFTNRDLNCVEKYYYRCKRIPKERKRTEWCDRRYILFLPSNTNEINLLTNGLEHNHDQLLKGQKRTMSPEMVAFIHDLYKKDTKKPSAVILHIDAARNDINLFRDEPNPNPRQLEYCLKKYNTGDSGKMINMGDLMKWCENSSSFPTNEDEAFVASYQIVNDKNKGFRFCMTTPKLLKIVSQCETLAIDATYKLNWMGFPLIILGSVDRQKRFHPLMYACATHETTEDYVFVFDSVKNCAASYIKQFIFSEEVDCRWC